MNLYLHFSALEETEWPELQAISTANQTAKTTKNTEQ